MAWSTTCCCCRCHGATPARARAAWSRVGPSRRCTSPPAPLHDGLRVTDLCSSRETCVKELLDASVQHIWRHVADDSDTGHCVCFDSMCMCANICGRPRAAPSTGAPAAGRRWTSESESESEPLDSYYCWFSGLPHSAVRRLLGAEALAPTFAASLTRSPPAPACSWTLQRLGMRTCARARRRRRCAAEEVWQRSSGSCGCP
jgi:hypothetical protein